MNSLKTGILSLIAVFIIFILCDYIKSLNYDSSTRDICYQIDQSKGRNKETIERILNKTDYHIGEREDVYIIFHKKSKSGGVCMVYLNNDKKIKKSEFEFYR